MTKNEAIQALREGKKLTHKYFTNGEFIEMQNFDIIDENGCVLRNFWNYRTSEIWNDGWSLI